MSCSTCGHTMEKINNTGAPSSWFWCPRCGTLREDATIAGVVDDSVPKLVGRCRVFAESLPNAAFLGPLTVGAVQAILKQLGIDESINPPDRRPQ